MPYLSFYAMAVLAAAIACFVGGWLAPELVPLIAAGLLIATRVLSPADALAGFGSPALITLMGLFVITQALLHSGALDRLRELLASPRIRTPLQLIALLALVVAPLSGLILNTAIVAILLPVIQSWIQRRRISPSRVLLPLSFATIIGGTLTLIGTSTNLLASDLAAGLGYGSFQILSFTAIGFPVWLLGSGYLLLSSRWLPDRGPADGVSLADLSRQGSLTEVLLPPASPLVGLNLHDSPLQRRFDVDVLEVHRDSQKLQPPLAQLRLAAGDRLLLRCNRGELLRLQQDQMVTLAGTDVAPALTGIRHAEVLVPAGSLLAGTSLRELRFRQRFNATVLAAKRTGATLRDRLGRLVLREGDLLLIQAPLDALRGLQQSSDLVLLDQLDADLPTTHRKHLAVAVMFAELLAVGVLVVGYCADAGSALGAIRWVIVLLLGGFYSLSVSQMLPIIVVFAASQSFLSPNGLQTNMMVFGPSRSSMPSACRRWCWAELRRWRQARRPDPQGR